MNRTEFAESLVKNLDERVKDLEARLRFAKEQVGDYNGMWIVLDLRVKQ